jgi:hypothetical protein
MSLFPDVFSLPLHFEFFAILSYCLHFAKFVCLLKRLQRMKQEWQKKSSWDQANIWQKLGLVWRNRKKISQIIKDYFYLPFYLLIILWAFPTLLQENKVWAGRPRKTLFQGVTKRCRLSLLTLLNAGGRRGVAGLSQ